MSAALRWFGRGLFVAVVATLMSLAGPEVAVANDCDYDRPTSGPYTCPPLDDQECFAACHMSGYFGGSCLPMGCCVCYY